MKKSLIVLFGIGLIGAVLMVTSQDSTFIMGYLVLYFIIAMGFVRYSYSQVIPSSDKKELVFLNINLKSIRQ